MRYRLLDGTSHYELDVAEIENHNHDLVLQDKEALKKYKKAFVYKERAKPQRNKQRQPIVEDTIQQQQ